MKTKQEIESKVKEFEKKLLDEGSAKDIIMTKIYSLRWVLNEL
ncbi:hypothetical protein [Tenacibaculum sp. 190524A02b]